MLFTSLQKIQFTNGIHKLNESIDELNKQLIESRNVHDQLNADFEKIYQENNELRQKYAQTHDSLLDTQNSFSTYKGKNCRFLFQIFLTASNKKRKTTNSLILILVKVFI